jgi:hypothetical protein
LEGKHVLQKLGSDDILVEDEELLSKEFITILRELNGDEIAELVGDPHRDGFVVACISSDSSIFLRFSSRECIFNP